MRTDSVRILYKTYMRMRKLSCLTIMALCLAAAGCGGSHREYTIKGSTSQDRLNGEKVYLVPYGSPQLIDSLGVDSVVIKDGKFEFRGDRGVYLARVTVDIRARYGTQDLLVVTEPGEISVMIDSVSYGKGTQQNDLLQSWKELKESNDRVQWYESQHARFLEEKGDTVSARALRDSLEQVNKTYVEQVHRLMRMAGPGPAYDFIRQRYGDPAATK